MADNKSVRHVVTSIVAGPGTDSNISPSFTRELVPHRYAQVTHEHMRDPHKAAQMMHEIQRNSDDASRSARSLPVLGGAYWPGQKITPTSKAFAHTVQVTQKGVSWLAASPRPTLVPGTKYTVSGAASNGAGFIRITTGSAHALVTGWHVAIQGILGTGEANGIWPITVIDTTHFDLTDSTFVNAYTSGGIVRVLPPHLYEVSQDATNNRITLACFGQAATFDLWFFPKPVAVRS